MEPLATRPVVLITGAAGGWGRYSISIPGSSPDNRDVDSANSHAFRLASGLTLTRFSVSNVSL